MNNIHEIIEQIKILEKRLSTEIQKKQQEFYYIIQDKKIYFQETTRQYHRSLTTSIPAYITQASLLNILTGPLVWACLIPAALLDLFVSIFQAFSFPIYGIPKVRRSDYIVVDRHALQYLNPIEKINCIYCGYFNGLIGYIQEIGARTEQYWCPIKHARKVRTIHNRYKNFLEYGDAETYKKKLEETRADFRDIEE
ncbi:MAG: hypothetical protein KJ950_13815 [Proteobacteria bacterium]|nr:hypothetical protein [Pseudomonadota bacterium]MBU1686086.1 hypothetical protein [Pseudomonadota bacterium]